jgi:hypothetical protein
VSTIVNLLFLPLSCLSGLFFPQAAARRASAHRPVAADLPLRPDRVAGYDACYGCDDYGADAGGSLALHIVVILAWTLLGLVLTAWGYQRELDRERS